jgi:hypothetical protein
MPEVSQEIVALLQYLLPGFLMAAVYYGLTSHPRPSQFERVVQALLFTVTVHATLGVMRASAGLLHTDAVRDTWTSDIDLAAKIVIAIVAGVALSAASNRDVVHAALRRLGVTHRSALAGEWHTVFATTGDHVILTLSDGSRITGWPEQWPSDPKNGHFFITQCAWISPTPTNDGCDVEGILISVADVIRVEFIKEVDHGIFQQRPTQEADQAADAHAQLQSNTGNHTGMDTGAAGSSRREDSPGD